jgi:hypothetical protein
MKLHSYVMTNLMLKKWNVEYKSKNLRKRSIPSKDRDLSKEDNTSEDEWMIDYERASVFPKNINLKNFWLFLWVPSLVYEPEFLRRSNRR